MCSNALPARVDEARLATGLGWAELSAHAPVQASPTAISKGATNRRDPNLRAQSIISPRWGDGAGRDLMEVRVAGTARALPQFTLVLLFRRRASPQRLALQGAHLSPKPERIAKSRGDL
jgi:hypothetical protein